MGWVNLDDLIGTVSSYYKADPAHVLKRHSRDNEGRQVLLYLACKHCRGRYKLGDIAKKVNIASVGGLSSSCKIITNRISEDKGLLEHVQQLEKLLI